MTLITILASCGVLLLVVGIALLERRFRKLEELLERQYRLIEGLSAMSGTIAKPVTNRIERRITDGAGTNATARRETTARTEPSPRGTNRLAEASPRGSKRLEPSPRSSYQLREAAQRDQLPEPATIAPGAPWEATHRITFQPDQGRSESWLVLVVAAGGGGRHACTKSEWVAGVPSAWSCTADGQWTYHGRPTPEGVKGRVVVDVFSPA